MKFVWRPLLVLVLLVVIGLAAASRLSLDYRLDAFLPKPADDQQALVVDQISAGPGGRVILAAISGAPADRLVDLSRELARQWRELPGVERVDNGEFELDLVTEQRLMLARFVLLPDIESRLTANAMTAQIEDRLDELTFGGSRVEALIQRDPLGLLPALAERLSNPLATADDGPAGDEVWLDASGERAYLAVISTWPAFAIAEQTELVDALEQRFTDLADDPDLTLTLGGTPIISVDSAARSRSNAVTLSLIGSAFLLLVLSVAWRSPALILAGAVPLATGVVCGLVVTALAFDQVHGLTLAFGFTLLGVALDYPIHLFGHARGRRLGVAARTISKPLLLGAASTVIAYLTIWLSTSPGLAQLGAFSAAGLTGAALATLLLPALGLPASDRNPRLGSGLPYWPWLPLLLAIAALAALAIQGEQRWSNDLTRLSPINEDLLAADIELRQAINPGDARHLLVVSDHLLESVLQAVEDTTANLEKARDAGLISGWQAATDLVPSRARQRQRAAAWPDTATLRDSLIEAAPQFRAEAFDPFLDDLEAFREAPPLDANSWDGSALALRVDSLLDATPDGWRSMILLSGLADAEAFETWLAEHQAPAALVDLRASSEAMVAAYRRDAGVSLAIALALIAGLLLLRLGQLRLTGLVLLPPLAAIACAAAIMSYFDDGLTLVHLIGLLLAGGIGLDFAIFTRTLAADRPAQARTNQAVNLCALSSGGVFLILGQSDIGLLRMLGLTAALGILLSWFFARICQPPCRRL